VDSVVQGLHAYQSIWMPVISEELPCEQDYYNGHNPFAVAVKKVV